MDYGRLRFFPVVDNLVRSENSQSPQSCQNFAEFWTFCVANFRGGSHQEYST